MQILVGIIVVILSIMISAFGLTPIINIGFGYVGNAGIFLVFLPSITVGVYKNIKYEREHPEWEKL